MNFNDILRYTHDGFRWLVVLITVIALVKYLVGWFGNGRYGSLDALLLRIFNIMLGVQFLIGLIFLVVLWVGNRFNYGLGTALTHALTMTLAVGVGGMVAGRVRRATTDSARFQTSALGVLAVVVLVFVGVQLVAGW